MARKKSKQRQRLVEAMASVRGNTTSAKHKADYHKAKKHLTGLNNLSKGNCVSALERKDKGHRWSKQPNKKFQSWNSTDLLAYQLGLVSKHQM